MAYMPNPTSFSDMIEGCPKDSKISKNFTQPIGKRRAGLNLKISKPHNFPRGLSQQDDLGVRRTKHYQEFAKPWRRQNLDIIL